MFRLTFLLLLFLCVFLTSFFELIFQRDKSKTIPFYVSRGSNEKIIFSESKSLVPLHLKMLNKVLTTIYSNESIK